MNCTLSKQKRYYLLLPTSKIFSNSNSYFDNLSNSLPYCYSTATSPCTTSSYNLWKVFCIKIHLVAHVKLHSPPPPVKANLHTRMWSLQCFKDLSLGLLPVSDECLYRRYLHIRQWDVQWQGGNKPIYDAEGTVLDSILDSGNECELTLCKQGLPFLLLVGTIATKNLLKWLVKPFAQPICVWMVIKTKSYPRLQQRI